MIQLVNARNYVVIDNIKELNEAKQIRYCMYIILEEPNMINIWSWTNGTWERKRYALSKEVDERDEETTGFRAYQSFYDYAGKEEVEKMKHILTPIPLWESYEQMHFFNYEYANQKIYQPVFCFDVNSSFTYGTMQLPSGFKTLKDYMSMLYNKKKEATNKSIRSKYKNLQNYLVGYFARIKDFVRVRSDIIKESNLNITRRILEVNKNGGIVYLSNTDSIVTNEKGAEIMNNYIGDNIGQFKLELKTDRLFYKSSNSYQMGDKLVYSGLSYFARKHTDFFEDKFAKQVGSFIKPFDFLISAKNDEEKKVCRVELDSIKVNVYNKIGERLGSYIYTI